MSQACISYSSLKDASSEAKAVSRKLETYANNLNTQIYKKLNSYSGSYTTNVSQAKSSVNAKISELNAKAAAYKTYATDLSDLKVQCAAMDKSVKSNISSLTASFKEANGIKDSKVQNTINYFLTSLGNSSVAGRWLGNQKDAFDSFKSYIKQSFEDWWDYEGGAELIKGIAIGVLEGVIAICAIVGAVLSGGALLVVIAGVVAGLIALGNAGVNIYNEVKAYNTTKNGDPATGRRRSDIDSAQDYLRSSFIYGDDGEKYEYDPAKYALATGIDVVNLVCTTITLVDSVGNLIKSAYKWTTGSMAEIKNLRIKDILTKDNFVAFKSKLGTTLKNGLVDIDHAIQTGDFTKISEFAFDFGDDFLNNLKKGYTFEIFAEDTKTKDFIKHGASLVKNYSSIAKAVINDGINVENIVSVGWDKVVVNNLNLAETVTYKGGNGGVLSYDIGAIKLTDASGVFEGIKDFPSNFKDIIGKLNDRSSISIETPDIAIPDLSGIGSIKVQIA